MVAMYIIAVNQKGNCYNDWWSLCSCGSVHCNNLLTTEW